MFNPQRILFLGMRPLASQCLSHLIHRMGRDAIVGVHTTQREAHKGKSKVIACEVTEVAEKYRLRLCSETSAHDIDYDLLLSILWDKRVKGDMLTSPRYGCINLHPAPLPRYRGMYTRTHAILNNDRTFGATMHYMVHEFDKGDIIQDIEFPILPQDTAYTLTKRTMSYAYALFCETWQRLLDGCAERKSQTDVSKQVQCAPQYYDQSSLDSFIVKPTSGMTAQDIDRRYRALTNPPELTPPAWLEDLNLQIKNGLSS